MLTSLRSSALAVALSLSMPEAVGQMQLSEDGRGEVLIFPFYSAASGEETSFVIHNHESHAKALYLRFREGLSGAQVLSFNLYLGPNDSFEGAVIKEPGGDGAAIATSDSSCTVPTISAVSTQADGRAFRVQPFLNYAYSENRSGYPVTKDSNTDIRRTLVGSIEVIEMGQWGGEQSTGYSPSAEVFEDIESRNCAALVERWSVIGGVRGEWLQDPRARALSWEGGGVSGELVITTPLGELTYPPFVIENFARNKEAGEYHVRPGEWEGPWPIPSLANGSLSVKSPSNGSTIKAASGLDAVAILLAKTDIGVGGSGGAVSSDRAVIVSFPTKWHHTNLEFVSDSGKFSSSVGEPFTVDWDPSTSSACEAVGFVGGSNTIGSTAGVVSHQLCGGINLLTASSSPGVLASEADWLSVEVPSIGEYPWAMSFADASNENGQGPANPRTINVGEDQRFVGMPVAVMPLAASLSGKAWVKGKLSQRLDVDEDGQGGSGAQSGESPDSGSDKTGSGASGDDSGTGSSEDTSSHFSKLLLEVPSEGDVYAGIGSIQGWAIDESGSIGSSIDFYIDGQYRGQIAHGDTRGDVGSAYPAVKRSQQSGFSAAFNFGELEAGWHELQVRATDSAGNALNSSINFYVQKFSGESYLVGDSAPKAGDATSCRMLANQIRCSGVSVSGATATVWLEWSPATQNFEIIRIE